MWTVHVDAGWVVLTAGIAAFLWRSGSVLARRSLRHAVRQESLLQSMREFTAATQSAVTSLDENLEKLTQRVTRIENRSGK